MYWYNPTARISEGVTAPSDDEEAVHMLAGAPDSAKFVSEYARLRRSGAPIERALVSVGHEFRLRQQEYTSVRLTGRERRTRARLSASGYEILLALRLREEGKDRREGYRSQTRP